MGRYCDKCWSLRADWLPENSTKSSTEAQSDFFGPHNKAVHKEDIIDSQNSVNALKLSALSEESVTTLKRTASLDTLPASDIDDNAVNLYISGVTSSQNSQHLPNLPSSTITKPQEAYKARIALDFDRPPLRKNDSGLGCSLSGIELPGSQDSASLTSSQESSSSIWKASNSAYSSLEILREKIARSPKTVSLMVPKSATSVVRVVSPVKSPIKILHHHTINKNILSPINVSQGSHLKSPDQILRKMSPIQQLLSPLSCASASQQPVTEKLQDLCTVCMVKPKEASIIHGKTGHQVCCYVCAKRLRRKGRPCPVCRRPIQKVIKNYLV